MVNPARGFVIAGPASGVGKTAVTLAVMAALRRRGYTVQPFKCGPDFIDGGHHSRVCGRTVRNLDGWMLSQQVIHETFYGAAAGAEICVLEGLMGLFDGLDGKSETGSTAEIAKILRLPVFLVVDASLAARSVAALVHGFETFDPDLEVCGVIFNKVAGETHYRLLADALAGSSRLPLIGFLPLEERIHIPERYLGLFTAGEQLLPDGDVDFLAEFAESHIELETLLACAACIDPVPAQPPWAAQTDVRIGVARDRAFCFYYEDNLDALRRAGAAIVEFSPLTASRLPDVDALYFGGGYPELHAAELQANIAMRSAVRHLSKAGIPIYAECGGLMYLSNHIVVQGGAAFEMAGILPFSVRMTDRLVKFGYTEVSFTRDCLLGKAGDTARGHSFHCSTIEDTRTPACVYRAHNRLSGRKENEGFTVGSTLASYIHLHFGSNSSLAHTFVENIRGSRAQARRRCGGAMSHLIPLVALIALLPISAAASRQLIDEIGRHVIVPDHAQRIICLAPSLTETVYALRGSKAVVGVTDYTTFAPGEPRKPSVGGLIDPSLERIIALRPDLVLAAKDVNTRETIEQLERYQVPVYVVDPKGIAGILNSVRHIGAAVDREHAAEELASNLERRWKAVAECIRALRKPTILAVIWHDPVISAGRNTFISEAIDAAGGQSATEDISQDWPQLSMEEVIRRDPDFLLIGAHKGIAADQLKRQQGWKNLSAVQQNHIIYVDERLEHSSPVLFDALEELARKLHPERFQKKEAGQ